ncbi:MAG TPA: anhydro-N-acetylmuramic acid kinase AnmK [Bacilli bacterium]|jgi:anhydro-N-acetylmuramic acid kinase|nr:anhydro-N-acetylmuramic acid kinase [Bacilli bacterium]HOE07041.1 anhydro-N-acetylmuramic acid kinase AnmK [Bacilli bacterium]HOR18053.1 anhydro-N-acetylmuramic acid kinase AnmK [Bacilli bacterium]HPL55725.1 anhydro-N-acetylmuramic acid kinase AnmK [Bacilli bacterium]
MKAIGLMSGTSLDGVDASLVNIENEKFTLIKFVTLPYEEDFKKKIMRNLSDETAKLSEICSLNFELGYQFVVAIDLLLEGTPYQYEDIDFVASHGQTIWHNPHHQAGLVPSTLQIGDASVIANKTGIKTISNFRTADMVVGGEGAPLVPMSEYMLFHSDEKNMLLQNIGGISNLTYLPKGCSIDEVIAFDCGPGNVMIDYFTSKYFQKPYDDGGKIALSGKVIKAIFDELKKDDFIMKKPPKSTGREKYSAKNMEKLAEELHFNDYCPTDIITTITEFTVYSICYHYQKYIKNFDEVIVSGGGSHNNYIIKRMREILNCKVLRQEDIGFSSDAKEAVAFVVLGYLTLQGKPGNVCSATGAKKPVILGSITPSRKSHVKG